MNKMDDNYIAENNVAERYLQNKLPPEEAIEFEEYILDKPELLERLELDSILMENLPSALEETKSVSSEPDEDKPSQLWEVIWGKPIIHSALSFAFGVLIVLLINVNTKETLPYSGAIDLVELSPLRSSSAQDVPDATYSLSNGADRIMLLLQPGYVESDNVSVDIVRRSDKQTVYSENVGVNSDGDIIVSLNTSSLTPGILEVDIRGLGELKGTQLLLNISQ